MNAGTADEKPTTSPETAALAERLQTIYPVCFSLGDGEGKRQIETACSVVQDTDAFPDVLAQQTGGADHSFLSDLARLEQALHRVGMLDYDFSTGVAETAVNPTLQLLRFSWKNLITLRDRPDGVCSALPEPGDEMIIVWQDPVTKKAEAGVASQEDLLLLKMVLEKIPPKDIASLGNLPVGTLDHAVERAARTGILLKPEPRIRRDPAALGVKANCNEQFMKSPFFTLQWHVTQQCDLHCKHCYDRSDRPSFSLAQALRTIDDLHSFCLSRNVRGQVTFTGGNPLLYPHFTEVYRAASDKGFLLTILGNPAPRERMEELIGIQMPELYQVSLEGLPEHNDSIRGRGHFGRVVTFLEMLRELGVSTMVMLTLTRDNIDHVIPLAEMLRDVVDDFHFNRLSMVGEGANLMLPDREKYKAFLDEYLATDNPILGIKDNLINIIHRERGKQLFGGCTGFGCGAAFNFISLLSDGEAHACRKFPSPIGNIREKGIAGVYDSEEARKYREGCRACKGCEIRPVCGGCLASAYSHGLIIFEERDPFCFMKPSW